MAALEERRRAAVALAAAGCAATVLAGCAGSVVQGNGSAPGAPGPVLSAHQIYAQGERGTVQIAGQVDMSSDEHAFGSGVLFDKAKGLVITNAHVVDGVDHLQVRFPGDSTSSASVVGRSPCNDLAVVKADHVPAAAHDLRLGNSSDVHVADEVYVIGFPGTLANITTEHPVFTQGSVQSVDVRVSQIPDLPTYRNTIQHSATVNHGNSGGPLFDNHGQVVGINTLSNFGTSTQQVQGQYYSIAINVVKSLLPQLTRGKSIDYAGWSLEPLDEIDLGTLFSESGYGTAAQGRAVEKELEDANVNGLVVTGVDPGTPAASVGVQPGELLTSIGGHDVSTVSQVCTALDSANSSPTPIAGYRLITGQTPDQAWTATLTV